MTLFLTSFRNATDHMEAPICPNKGIVKDEEEAVEE
jgi:hypothetical protein